MSCAGYLLIRDQKTSLRWHIVPFAQSKSINLSDKTTRSITRNGIVAQKQNSYLSYVCIGM